VRNDRLVLAALMAALCAGTGCAKVKGMFGHKVNADSVAQADRAAAARRDSLAKAQARRDSVARARFATCSDSVEKALRKTKAGRAELARKAKLPAGMQLESVVRACGAAPAAAPAASTPATAAGKAAPAATAPAKGAPPPTAPAKGTPAAPATTPPARTPAAAAPATPAKAPAMTPAQQRVARADSVRKVREQARADSLAKVREQARVDSIAKVRADSIRQDSIKTAKETEILRESFAYTGGARDPFQSLIERGGASVEFGDLVLVAIYQDLRSARNSVAVLRNKANGKRYKVHTGDRIGTRMTVSQITDRDVTFTIEDFGFERQETLSLTKKGQEDNR
jgi:hypothetical protein